MSVSRTQEPPTRLAPLATLPTTRFARGGREGASGSTGVSTRRVCDVEASDHIDVASLEPMFRPGSVAIIGASSDPARIGGTPPLRRGAGGGDGSGQARTPPTFT